MSRLLRSLLLLCALLLALPTPAARACAVCMGADENTGEALNGAIYIMLGCIFTMLALISAVGISLVRRAAHHDQTALHLTTALE